MELVWHCLSFLTELLAAFTNFLARNLIIIPVEFVAPSAIFKVPFCFTAGTNFAACFARLAAPRLGKGVL